MKTFQLAFQLATRKPGTYEIDWLKSQHSNM